MPYNLLVVILGPTASGKTGVSLALAEHFHSCIFSADSRQLFREIPVGTAQPAAAELEKIPHYFIASHSVQEHVDAGIYARLVHDALEKQFVQREIIFLAGGSGLYIDAVLNGFDALPEKDEKLRKELQEKFEKEGIEFLQNELRRLDPAYFEKVDRNNPARLLRAVEVCLLTGKKYSELRSGKKHDLPFDVLKIGMEVQRGELYERINMRVNEMMKNGLEEEARKVFPFRESNALQTVGYKELFDYFDGKIPRDKAVELIKQHTRNFAKRQMTWWRNDPSINWFPPDDLSGMKEFINSMIQKFKD